MSDPIKDNLNELDQAGIPYDYRRIGSKDYAVVPLENGNKLMFCAFTGNTTFMRKTYSTKSGAGFVRFMERNKLKVKHGS